VGKPWRFRFWRRNRHAGCLQLMLEKFIWKEGYRVDTVISLFAISVCQLVFADRHAIRLCFIMYFRFEIN
jgi:hypothetical protein